MDITRVLVIVTSVRVMYSLAIEYPETDNRTYTACSDEFTSASCDVSKVILMNSVLGGSKPQSNACPIVPVSTQNPECCGFEVGDCLYPTPNSYVRLYSDCNGLVTCNRQEALGVTNADSTICSSTDFQIFSQYIQLNYFCVEANRIGKMCVNQNLEEKSDRPLYLQSQNYPDTFPSGDSTCDCSIQTQDNSKTITVYYILTNLYTENGVCQQSLIFEDGDVNRTTTCDDNNNYQAQEAQSSTNFIRLIWTNNAASKGGQFWVGFYAASSTLTVNCPAVSREPTTTSTSTTTPTTTSTSTPTPTTTATTSSATGYENSTVSDVVSLPTSMMTASNPATTTLVSASPNLPSSVITTSDSEFSNVYIAVACVIGFLFLLVCIAIGIMCFRFQKLSKQRVNDIENPKVDTPENDNGPTILIKEETGNKSAKAKKRKRNKRAAKNKSSFKRPVSASHVEVATLTAVGRPRKGRLHKKESKKGSNSARNTKQRTRPKSARSNKSAKSSVASKTGSKRRNRRSTTPSIKSEITNASDNKLVSNKSFEPRTVETQLKSERSSSVASKTGSKRRNRRSTTPSIKSETTNTSDNKLVSNKSFEPRSVETELRSERSSSVLNKADHPFINLDEKKTLDSHVTLTDGCLSQKESEKSNDTKMSIKRKLSLKKNRQAILKQTRYYESRLKIVKGSIFSYSNFFRHQTPDADK